MPILQDVRS